MATRKKTLKSFFETGKIPNQKQYALLIDSNVNLAGNNIGNIQLVGDISASGGISASGTIKAEHINSSDDIVATDKITAGGDIESGGNIKAGGIGTTAGFFSNNEQAIVYTNVSGENLNSFGSTSSNFNVLGTSAIFNQPITASSNISASGVDYTFGTTRILNGNITSSGNISSSAGGLNHFGGDIELDVAKKIQSRNGNFIQFNDQDIQFTTNIQTVKFSDGETIFNDGGHSTQDFRVESDTKTHALFVDANINKVGIGRGSALDSSNSVLDVTGDLGVSSHITASGNISASGDVIANNLNIDGSQVDFTNLPTSDPTSAGRLFTQTATQLGGSGTTKVICVSAG